MITTQKNLLLIILIFNSFWSSAQWKLDKNKIVTGGLVFVGGAAKGFNETLQFNYKIFDKRFDVNDKWFDPRVSWRNKYEGGNPDNGARFFLSTSLFVAATDQYHLNNFIHKASILSALVIKIGDKKQPFKYYIFDFIYYYICYSVGFVATYYPFTSRKY